jgi:hypothetical protein
MAEGTNLNREPRNKKLPGKRKYLFLAGVILVLAILAYVLVINKNNGPLPHKTTAQVSFPVFYPRPLPPGYKYQKDTAKVERGILFYNLAKGKNVVSVSEQVAPPVKPDFETIQKSNNSYKKLDVPAGQALIGISNTEPFGIIVSNTTLVNIHAGKQVPLDVITKFVNSMSSL